MKTKIIGEIGINHFGKKKIIQDYLENFKGKGLDGITIQILKKKKVGKKLKKFCLKRKDIEFFLKEAKKKYKSVGIAIHTWDDFEFLSRQKIDFIKVLGSSFGNFRYIQKVKRLKVKKIFLSTGGKSIEEIKKFIKIIKSKKIKILYTFFKTKNFLKSINNISLIKNKLKIPVSYGNHYSKINKIYQVKKYNPSEIFLYLKMDEKINYPDNKHAIPLNKISVMIKNLKK